MDPNMVALAALLAANGVAAWSTIKKAAESERRKFCEAVDGHTPGHHQPICPDHPQWQAIRDKHGK